MVEWIGLGARPRNVSPPIIKGNEDQVVAAGLYFVTAARARTAQGVDGVGSARGRRGGGGVDAVDWVKGMEGQVPSSLTALFGVYMAWHGI